MVYYRFFYKPIIRDDDEKASALEFTWLKLFFDLLFVVVIAQHAFHLSLQFGFRGSIDRLLTLQEAFLFASASGLILLAIAALQFTLRDIHNNRKQKNSTVILKIDCGILLILSEFIRLASHILLIAGILVFILLQVIN